MKSALFVPQRSNYNGIASGNYTQAGTYSFSFTPTTTGNYSIQFYMNHAAPICEFSVANVSITYQHTENTLVCENLPTSGYRYGYQGSEKDNEVKGSGNSYTTYFRQLAPRVGRWLTIDPKATPWESPYVSMGNNPIWHNDVLGDTWNPKDGSQGKADNFRKKTNDLVATVNDKIMSVKDNMAGLDKSSDEYKNFSTDLTNLKERLGELKNSISDLDRLETSSQVYSLQARITNPAGQGNVYTQNESGQFVNGNAEHGNTYYQNGIVVMTYNTGEIDALAHEIAHGAQYDRGETSFDKTTFAPGKLYDLTDEQAAFRRGSAYQNTGWKDIAKPLLNISRSDLITKLGYSSSIPAMNLNSKQLIETILITGHGGTQMDMKYQNKTFDSYEGDIIHKQ